MDPLGILCFFACSVFTPFMYVVAKMPTLEDRWIDLQNPPLIPRAYKVKLSIRTQT